MSIIQITDKYGTKEIDLGKVEEFTNPLQHNWYKGNFSYPENWFDTIKESSKDQLEHLVSSLIGLACLQARLYHSSFTKDHVKIVNDIHDLKRIAKSQGLDLWPEIGD